MKKVMIVLCTIMILVAMAAWRPRRWRRFPSPTPTITVVCGRRGCYEVTPTPTMDPYP